MIKYLGQGRMRVAFKVGNYVVKFPKNKKGIRACLDELSLWVKHKSDAMAPVLFSIPGLMVAMPYYPNECIGRPSGDFIKKLNAFGIIDLHRYNLRTHNNKPIAIDYGINRNSRNGQGEPTDD
jgi:hypothetical protein